MDESSDLRVACGAYRRAQAHRDVSMDVLKEAVRSAVAAGMSKNEVIRVTGLSRRTVYGMFK